MALLLGCGIKPDGNFELYSGTIDSTNRTGDEKNNLSELEETFPNLDYNKVIKEQSKIISSGMSITVFKYFVIFSDLDDELTYKLIDTDIRNTVEAMTNNYVNKLPDIVTPIYLFSEYDDYKEFVLKNYDIPENDISPYGFFKISKNVIVIRYVSWKGSILHEITHRFIKADFPNAPSWFDEGFASLNEKSVYKNGNLIGDFSLRIIPLRRAINEDTYTGLQYLMETNDNELYGKRAPYYYAQARYLLMYLQENGMLDKYYRNFRDTHENDNTGISQIKEITGKSLVELDEEYLNYIKSFKQN
ncbi:MAG: hypothetical protein ABI543_02510 [Ignavibacteria bacterium]